MKSMINARGKEIPSNLVRPVDKIRDSVISNIAEQAEFLSKKLSKFKEETFLDIYNFLELSASKYDTSFGGEKGNVTLTSFDGNSKVVLNIKENIAFDERLQIAKKLIDECIKIWVEDSRDEIKILVDRAFQVDKKGQINIRRILELRQVNILDEKWQLAMVAIGEAITVTNSKEYIRVYKRIEDGSYELINLDIAKL
jgi:hypothetical protein